MAKDVLDNLKDHDGKYRVINAKLVSGAVERLHIGCDENAKTRTIRRMANCFKVAMSELHGEVEGIHFRAHKEAIFADRVGICKFEPMINTIMLCY